jgi:hypothetical protein
MCVAQEISELAGVLRLVFDTAALRRNLKNTP